MKDAVKDVVRNRRPRGTGKACRTREEEEVRVGQLEGLSEGVGMDKRSQWKIEHRRELYGGKDCFRHVGGVNERCGGTGELEESSIERASQECDRQMSRHSSPRGSREDGGHC